MKLWLSYFTYLNIFFTCLHILKMHKIIAKNHQSRGGLLWNSDKWCVAIYPKQQNAFKAISGPSKK